MNEGTFGLGMPSRKSSQWSRAFPDNFCRTAGLYALLSLYITYLDDHHLTPDDLSGWIRAIHPRGVLNGHCKGNAFLVIREGQKRNVNVSLLLSSMTLATRLLAIGLQILDTISSEWSCKF